MMTTLFAVSVLALAVLAVWFVAVLAIRLFTKRRPPLCTRFTVAVAVVAVGIIALLAFLAGKYSQAKPEGRLFWINSIGGGASAQQP